MGEFTYGTARRQHEGPAALLEPNPRSTTSLLEKVGNSSHAERLDAIYGHNGWAFYSTAEQLARHSLQQIIAAASNTLVQEAVRNNANGEGYVSNEGAAVPTYLKNQATRPLIGYVVIYPDGEHQFAETQGYSAHYWRA